MTGQREKAVAFVVLRLTSSRLPSKQLRQIGGETILERIVGNLRAVAEIDQVVLATVDELENRPLREIAAAHGWDLFWYAGDVDDVVGRLCAAADTYAADICLLISADCPLVHGPSIDQVVREFRQRPEADLVGLPPDARGRHCLLEGVQVARSRAWKKADALSDTPELREHQFPVFYQRAERFHRLDVVLDTPVYGSPHRLSVDTWADLEFMQTLERHLGVEGLAFSLPNVVDLLNRRPQLKQVNAHVHQRRLIEDVRRVLYVVDAGGPFGYGHFMRCRELAGQVVERLSWPATFLVDDERAAQMAEASGFGVVWGALGRPTREEASGRRARVKGDMASECDLAVVDITVRRSLEPGWRDVGFGDRPVVVIDRDDAMAAEAALIVFPGVNGREGLPRSALPPTLEGLEHVILRREVARYQGLGLAKTIDILVYLYDDDPIQQIEDVAAQRGWQVHILSEFGDDFPELLARSRVFVSGYGHSFYEALALQTYPIAWPLSPAHEADAMAFYRAFALPAAVAYAAADIVAIVGAMKAEPYPLEAGVNDGTPRVVEHLRGLLIDR
jgi:spore coat polysaccharide biosynthesis protein SpsF